MAAHAYSGPVAVHDAAPLPVMGAERTAAEGVSATANLEAKDEDANAADKDNDDDDDDDDGAVWDTASLYEEILDEVSAFEYSANGAYLTMRRHIWQLIWNHRRRDLHCRRGKGTASATARGWRKPICFGKHHQREDDGP